MDISIKYKITDVKKLATGASYNWLLYKNKGYQSINFHTEIVSKLHAQSINLMKPNPIVDVPDGLIFMLQKPSLIGR